jgi:hypothetical protein
MRRKGVDEIGRVKQQNDRNAQEYRAGKAGDNLLAGAWVVVQRAVAFSL